MLFAQGCYVSGDIYAGDYTEKEIGYLTKNDGGVGPVIANLTGEQLYRLVETILKEKDSLGAVCNVSTLYVSSGFEMQLLRGEDGYTLEGLTIDGKELDKQAVYSVFILSDRDWISYTVMKDVGCEDYNMDTDSCEQLLMKRLVEKGGKLETPQEYISISDCTKEQEAH